MRTPADLPRRLPRTSRRARIAVLIVVVLVIFLLLGLRGLATFWTDYLWFEEVHYTSVFRGVLVTKVVLAVVFTVIFFLMMLASLTVADRVAPIIPAEGPEDDLVNNYRDNVAPHGRWVRLVTSFIFAIFAGVGTDREWNNWILFRYHRSFGVSDPEFHKDVGFYVFQLPFIKFLLDWFFVSVAIILVVTVVAHYLNGGIRFQSPGQRATAAVKTHISVLFGILALMKAVAYYFQRLELVLSTNHLVDGATATVVHAEKPAKTLLIAIAIIAAGLFLYNIRQKGWTLPAAAVVLWGLVWILIGGVYPALYQQLRVDPSELTREQPYLARNITATRAVYGINNVQVEENSAGNETVDSTQINGSSPQAQANQTTLANVRLLDPSQIKNTFVKDQALRNYYTFNTLGADRYAIGGPNGNQLVQTIVAVRELNQGSGVLSGFVNQHLEYTHGYGAVVTQSNQAGVQSDGNPNFSLAGIPPTATGLTVSTPTLTEKGSQVYYGVGSVESSFVVANSKQTELDYEDSQGNQVSTHYAGSGGVPAGGFVRRLAFALRFGSADMILSGQITSQSRVMYNRNIVDRVKKAAPFLKYDADPYPVIVNGQIYWIIDAYTVSDNYPYAQTADTDRVPSNSGLNSTFNYVRNSVKVVINAYNGKMDFFVMNTSDPIIAAYEQAFPDLFTPVSKADHLIPGITEHFRYPEDLFRVQTNMYGRYHLTNTSEFYTQAQAWGISQDPGSGQLNPTQFTASASPTAASGATGAATISQSAPRFQPEYILAAPPGSTQQSFMLLQPFEPVSGQTQQNLTAFMTASSDPADYGKLTVYETPPSENVNGPALVLNAIKSNTEISGEFTLLDEGGSNVVLGQVQIVPIDETLLYVEPVYVQSNTNRVPTLKDVVVVYNGTAYQSSNASLDNALCQIVNPNGSKPFAMYCNTAAANEAQSIPSTTPGTGSSGSNSNSTSTTTTPTTTLTPATTTVTVPPAPGTATVASLLAQAQAEFAAADQALKSGNLAAYQADITQANTYVQQAAKLEASTSTATTPTSSSTTVPKSKTTTTTKKT